MNYVKKLEALRNAELDLFDAVVSELPAFYDSKGVMHPQNVITAGIFIELKKLAPLIEKIEGQVKKLYDAAKERIDTNLEAKTASVLISQLNNDNFEKVGLLAQQSGEFPKTFFEGLNELSEKMADVISLGSVYQILRSFIFVPKLATAPKDTGSLLPDTEESRGGFLEIYKNTVDSNTYETCVQHIINTGRYVDSALTKIDSLQSLDAREHFAERDVAGVIRKYEEHLRAGDVIEYAETYAELVKRIDNPITINLSKAR